METKTETWLEKKGHIHPDTRLGHIHLNVANLEKQFSFYQQVLGLKLHRRNKQEAALGAGHEDLLILSKLDHAQTYQGYTGLYHFCILVQERIELAQLLRRMVETHTPVQGLVDHRSSEAIYLEDPEGNGIELNHDHPREAWPNLRDFARLGNLPLDVDSLMGELAQASAPWQGLPASTRIGHVHLQVTNLKEAENFYHNLLGFDKVMSIPRQAVFVSAGGYHHHVAFNIWNGKGAPFPPADATGLKHFSVLLPNATELDKILGRLNAAGLKPQKLKQGYLVQDPSHNGVLLSL